MTGILDVIPGGLILVGLDDWPRSASRQEWFAVTRALFRTPSAIWTWTLPLWLSWKRRLSELAYFAPQESHRRRADATP